MSSQTNASVTPEGRILRRAEVEAKTGLKRASIYSLMRTRKPSGDGYMFPQTVPLGKRAVGWWSVEIDQWIADRLKERG